MQVQHGADALARAALHASPIEQAKQARLVLLCERIGGLFEQRFSMHREQRATDPDFGKLNVILLEASPLHGFSRQRDDLCIRLGTVNTDELDADLRRRRMTVPS